ncbi:MAG: hypothetical protein L6E13_01615 [Firmicutes bacterium]|nr:hypothetical protein [Bacillota bacterium]
MAQRSGGFWRGFAAGAAMVALGGLILALAVSSRGVTIAVDARALGAQVEAAVRREVADQLPRVLETAGQDLPDLVAARIAQHLTAGPLPVGPVEVDLPPALREELRRRLTLALAEAGRSYLAGLDQEEVAALAGREARRLVESQLLAGGRGYRVLVRLLPWWAVPVTVRGR